MDAVIRAINEGENIYRQTVLGQPPLPGYPIVGEAMTRAADEFRSTRRNPGNGQLTMLRDGVNAIDLGVIGNWQYAVDIMDRWPGGSKLATPMLGSLWRRKASEQGTYGGWRWESTAGQPGQYPRVGDNAEIAKRIEALGNVEPRRSRENPPDVDYPTEYSGLFYRHIKGTQSGRPIDLSRGTAKAPSRRQVSHWRFVDAESGSEIGSEYRTRAALVADRHNVAADRGYPRTR